MLKSVEPQKSSTKSFTYQTNAGNMRTGVKKVRSFEEIKSDNIGNGGNLILRA